jgi:hypothetical protein
MPVAHWSGWQSRNSAQASPKSANLRVDIIRRAGRRGHVHVYNFVCATEWLCSRFHVSRSESGSQERSECESASPVRHGSLFDRWRSFSSCQPLESFSRMTFQDGMSSQSFTGFRRAYDYGSSATCAWFVFVSTSEPSEQPARPTVDSGTRIFNQEDGQHRQADREDRQFEQKKMLFCDGMAMKCCSLLYLFTHL